ncbi:MAG: hypothetical protein ACLTZM_02485 [Ruminococcus sp.]
MCPCLENKPEGHVNTVGKKRFRSERGFFQSEVEVCVVEEETSPGQQLNGVTLNDGIYEVEAASVRAEELVGLAESYSPDVLILLEQSKEELDETLQKEIDLWQAEEAF